MRSAWKAIVALGTGGARRSSRTFELKKVPTGVPRISSPHASIQSRRVDSRAYCRAGFQFSEDDAGATCRIGSNISFLEFRRVIILWH